MASNLRYNFNHVVVHIGEYEKDKKESENTLINITKTLSWKEIHIDHFSDAD
jgi:hypothetical protein